jgi:nitrogen regulatory protein PII 2
MLKGAEKGYEEAIAQLGQSQRLVPKRMITVMAPDRQVPKIIETIISINQTGKSGDGKIFVMPLFEAFRVRTGESGDETIG